MKRAGQSGNVESVIYKGVTYRRYPDAKGWADRMYYVPAMHLRQRGLGRLHQEIWKDAHGPIPDGHDIHHKDGDSLNNALDNLECLPSGYHQAYHGSLLSYEERERRRAWFNSIRDRASAWHRSEEGRAWHRALSLLSWDGREPHVARCDHCGSDYQTLAPSGQERFCSNKCRAAARRKRGVDNEDRTCACCGAMFTVNKYAKTQCCSRTCAQRHRRTTA